MYSVNDFVKRIILFNRELGNASKLIPCLYGETGVGKTSIVREIANDLGKQVHVMLLHHMLPEDVAGVPRITSRGTVKWARPEIYNSDGILFLDELDKPHRDLQGAVLTLIAENRIGDTIVKADLVAAMQPVSADEFLADETGKALAARLIFIPVDRNSSLDRIEKLYGVNVGFLKNKKGLEFPLLPEPSPRQIEWLIKFWFWLLAREENPETIFEFVVTGVLPGDFGKQLIENLKSPHLGINRYRGMLRLCADDEYVMKLTVEQIEELIKNTWLEISEETFLKLVREAMSRMSAEDCMKFVYRLMESIDVEKLGGPGATSIEIVPGSDETLFVKVQRILLERFQQIGYKIDDEFWQLFNKFEEEVKSEVAKHHKKGGRK